MARTRIYIDVNSELLRRLILWSVSRDQPRTQWLKTVLTLRCEANWDKVETWLDDKAKRLGVTREELENQILVNEGFDLSSEREEIFGSIDKDTEGT